MNECLSDLKELTSATLVDFEHRLSSIVHDDCKRFHEEANRLDGELILIYRMVMLTQKHEDDLDKVSQWWGLMVWVCDKFSEKLNKLVTDHPKCGADEYYNRVLDLRIRCQDLQKMHS